VSVKAPTSPRVVLYARFSSANQSEHSIEDQLRICRVYAERHGWEVLHEFRDAAISGATLSRPGFQALQEAMRRGGIDIVLAEALDRFSRDQEHIAGFHKLVAFTGVRFFTISEGEISSLHVGMKGTMNAMFLTELANKTRRGLEGRVRAGRGTGTVPYGYRRVTGILRPDGEVERGLRELDPGEAAIVRRIFSEYVMGLSPIAIARRLNEEHIPGPTGQGWNHFTIRGRSGHDTGLLRNHLYVGKSVWNRRHRVRDPLSGQAVMRANAAEDRVVAAVPELRIVDDALWEKVQARLALEAIPADSRVARAGFWEKRRPKHLLSGKVFCGTCGGPCSALRGRAYACTKAEVRLCTNRTTANREKLERNVLDVMARQMMDPDLAELFAAEFTAEWNRLSAEAGASRAKLGKELDGVERQLANLVEAITNGLRSSTLQVKLSALETERDRLIKAHSAAEPTRVRLLPNLGTAYRNTVARLHEAISAGDNTEAVEAARGLIARVVIHPAPPRKPPGITIEGQFAAMLQAAQPDLSAHAAQIIATATHLAVKENAGGQSRLASTAPYHGAHGAPRSTRTTRFT
jgi:DNA invertase Pin-like site-specific DNA recombinase